MADIFYEFSDSFPKCGLSDENGNDIGNCYYEHSVYRTGMRYNGRNIGSSYDNDAKTYVLGAISQLGIDTRLPTKIRYLDLNYDNQDKAPNNPIIGNTVTSIAEKIWMISSSVQHDYKNWRFTLATDFSHSTFYNDISNESDFNASLMVEYNM